MGLQEQIAEAIVVAFDELGGDPQNAMESAVQHDSVDSWLQQEVTKIAVAGGAEMLIPGLHALTIPAGISYLIHKMAHISWGIGAIKGAYVIETAQHSDLRNILSLWANSAYFNAHLLDHLAISMDAFEYAITPAGQTALTQALAKHDDQNNVVMGTLNILQELSYEFSADEHAQHLYQTVTGKPVPDLMVSARDPLPTGRTGTLEKAMSRRISTRLALKLGARISARVPARFIVGFIPIAGAIVNGFFNAQTLTSMADSAQKYYDNALRRDTFADA